MSEADIATFRAGLAQRGMPVDAVSDDDLRKFIGTMGEMFRDNAPVSAAQAATVILDGVRNDRWRILVGDDAHALDEAVRANPEKAYAPDGPSLSTLFRS
jgi:hypothetical protein